MLIELKSVEKITVSTHAVLQIHARLKSHSPEASGAGHCHGTSKQLVKFCAA